ncbi:MAG: NUDIX domain-containing protein [Steroidobacteraceae bacterium]|nr:NUDIX domain-containing protein [Steroidobacteraceae bacterium]
MNRVRPPNLSAGVVVVRQAEPGWLFLMLRAYRNWDFPKGLVESGEDPLDAARREVTEETLISDLQFPWGERYYETAPYSRNKVARYYVGETHSKEVTLPVRPELGRPEHHECRWVPYEEALELASPRIAPVLQWAAAQIGITSPHEIPATAEAAPR